jgi:hypothetical protein
MSRLTKDEQYSLMTLFTIFKSPLMFGGDLPGNDDFTLSLLTNRDVLKMHKESSHVQQLSNTDDMVAITSVNKNTGEVYLALFNLSDNPDPKEITVNLLDLDFTGECRIKDLWSGEDLGKFSDTFNRKIKGHASGLYVIF